VGSDGGVFVFHGGFYGSLPGLGIHVDNIVGIAPAANYDGYYLVGSDGGVFSFGDTGYEGSLPGLGIHVNDVVGIVPSSDDKGYFLVGADGGVFSFGDTAFEGSLPGLGAHVDDVAGIAATPSNTGYWVLEASGQVTGFGDAPNLAQLQPLPESTGAARYVAIVSTPDGQGYWVVNNFGQVFAVGDAHWLGNVAYNPSPLVSIVPTGDKAGYWIVGSDGAIFTLGDATSYGSLPALGIVPNFPIVGAAPTVASPPPPPPPPVRPPTTSSTVPTSTTKTTTPESSLPVAVIGNTCGAVGSCHASTDAWGNTMGGVPETVADLAVSRDGLLASSAAWEENAHNVNIYSPQGWPEGETTGNSGDPPGNTAGTFGLAVDSTYIYGATGNGYLVRFSRSAWLGYDEIHGYDPGNQSGVNPLAVDAGSNPLLGMTECNGYLYVSDANGPLTATGLSPSTTEIKEVPTNLSGVTRTWAAPGAGVLACDREGHIWALVENPVGTADTLERFSPTGSLLTSFTLPTSVIAQGVAASPNSDELLVADNGVDQNFKWFNYSGTQTGQLGVTGGYLQGSDPGLIGPDRAVGPRSVAIDGSGNIYTAENCMPGIAQSVTTVSDGPCAIITEYQSNGTAVDWRDANANTFGGTGEPTADGSTFFDRDFEFKRDASGNYQPYAFTVDPWKNPSDNRVSAAPQISGAGAAWYSQYGATTYEWDADGHRYEGTYIATPASYTIYEQQANSEIMTPVYTFTPGVQDLFMDSSQNMWGVVDGGEGGNNVVEYPLTGFTSTGTPEYGSAISYGMPPGLVDVRRVDVEGNAIYVSGFSTRDTDDSSVWGNWESMGMTLIKFDSLPTTSGWPSAAWTTDPIYTLPADTKNPFPEPFGFAVTNAVNGAANVVGVAMLFEQSSPAPDGTNLGDIGALKEFSASTGAYEQTLTPPLPGPFVTEGQLDQPNSVVSKNGWFWLEDDWFTRIIGIRQ
jgi:hypothetical protein